MFNAGHQGLYCEAAAACACASSITGGNELPAYMAPAGGGADVTSHRTCCSPGTEHARCEPAGSAAAVLTLRCVEDLDGTAAHYECCHIVGTAQPGDYSTDTAANCRINGTQLDLLRHDVAAASSSNNA